MTSRDSSLLRFVRELRRRRVFRAAALYIVGAWLVMQAADVFFPAWGVPEAVLNVLLAAAFLGFPLALFFGWFYEITAKGILRTPSADEDSIDASRPLRHKDIIVLAALVTIAAFIIYDAGLEIAESPMVPVDGELAELMPIDRLANSVAVLPFTNISNDPDNEAFCNDISEEILNKLAAFTDVQISGITVNRATIGKYAV